MVKGIWNSKPSLWAPHVPQYESYEKRPKRAAATSTVAVIAITQHTMIFCLTGSVLIHLTSIDSGAAISYGQRLFSSHEGKRIGHD